MPAGIDPREVGLNLEADTLEAERLSSDETPHRVGSNVSETP
jgi:hypothetical protein